jgi:hypothetical protein
VDAPVLTAEDIEIIKNDETIQDAIQLSLFRMIRYYEKNDYWITQKNHNFLRITRILRCLWLAGRVNDYVCLQRILDDIYIDYSDIISDETFAYWKYANDDDFFAEREEESLKKELEEEYKELERKTESEHRNPYDDDDGDSPYNYV